MIVLRDYFQNLTGTNTNGTSSKAKRQSGIRKLRCLFLLMLFSAPGAPSAFSPTEITLTATGKGEHSDISVFDYDSLGELLILAGPDSYRHELENVCCFYVQKRLQLSSLVVLLQPVLVVLQHISRSQDAKVGYITPKDALLQKRRRAFFCLLLLP